METPTTLADTLRERIIALEALVENASNAANSKVAVLESQVESLQQQLMDRLESSRESLALALASAEKTTEIAQTTADKAMVKADAKADMAYLEAQIRSLKEAFSDQITAQKEAITAALNASQSALKAALESSEKAITKAEEANEKRFQCVEASTLILCADLTWKPAGDLKIGDELIGFDEQAPTRRGRRYRRSTVTDNSIVEDRLLLVATDAGAVRCNANHPWLSRTNPRANWQWKDTKDLRPGNEVMRALTPWEVDRTWEAGWLAGMYDGEGCLMLDKNKRTQLTISQRESETATKIHAELNARVNTYAYRQEAGADKRTQPIFRFLLSRVPDVLTILGSIRPPRLMAYAEKAWNGKPLGSWHRAVRVISIEENGRGHIARLSTSTKTYIAAGFAMHNSVNEFRAQLSDQQKTFVVKDEVEFKFQAVEKKMDESLDWQRRCDLKFSDYLQSRTFDNFIGQTADWRRQVDAALTATASSVIASKSTVQTGRDNVAMIVSIVAVLVALAVAVIKFQ